MSILDIILENKLITESQVEAKQIANSDKYSFSMDDLRELKAQLDDSKLYKYLGWIARNWETFSNKSEIAPLIKTYNELVNSGVLDDKITSYKDADELIDNVNTAKVHHQNKINQKESEKKFDVLWQNDDKSITVVAPRTKSASIKLGRDTRWCTAADKNPGVDYDPEHYFCKYVLEENGQMIYIINYNLPKNDPFYKTAIRLSENGRHIEEIRDINNSPNDNYAMYGDYGYGWNDEYNEYLEKWDIPLTDILDDNYDDLDDEREAYTNSKIENAVTHIEKESKDLPETVRETLIDNFHEAAHNPYEYDADNIEDLESMFIDWVGYLQQTYESAKKLASKYDFELSDIDWDEVVNNTISENDIVSEIELIEDYLDSEISEDIIETITNNTKKLIEDIKPKLNDKAYNELIDYIDDTYLSKIMMINKMFSDDELKNRIINVLNIVAEPEFDDVVKWFNIYYNLFNNNINIDKLKIIDITRFLEYLFDDDISDILKSDNISSKILNASNKITDKYTFNMLGGEVEAKKNPEEFADKFIKYINNNIDKIKNNILNQAKIKAKKEKIPVALVLRDELDNTPYTKSNIPNKFKYKVVPIIDKLYNTLIDDADSYDDAVEFSKKHPNMWNSRDESEEIDDFLTYIHNNI